MAIPLVDVNALRELLTCPLAYELFLDPVVEVKGTCGHVFERKWIEEWVANNQSCPISRSPLALEQLVPHDLIRDACVLLDPTRVEPLVEGDFDLLRQAEEAFTERRPVPAHVAEEIHRSLATCIGARVAALKAQSKEYCGY